MSETAFRVSELRAELLMLAEVGKRFLAPASEGVLRQAAQELSAINSKKQAMPWVVSMHRPIVTKPNEGWHQADGRGASSIWGKICWAWELKLSDKDVVQIAGKASTLITLVTEEAGSELELLSMCLDVGVTGGPGTTFHSQVKAVRGCALEAAGSEVDIPRLPSVVLTPAECVELVIAELYQDKWARKVHETHNTNKGVYRAQRQRLRTLLTSAAAQVGRAEGSSALIALKQWRPQGTAFAHSSDRASGSAR